MLAELPVAMEVVLKAVIVVAAFLVLPLALGQLEHKLMGHMQGRLGPMEAGPHGILQLVADGIKFVQKEDVIPAAADRPMFRLAPAVALIPYLVALAVIPWSATWVAADVPASLLFALAATSVGVIGTLMAGWGSGNKYALIGGMRAGAQLVSYELPMVLSAASVAIAAGTLSLTGIVQEWSWWWLAWQAPAAFVFLAAAVAELQRTPFDAPVADAEIVFGPLTEYTGLRFAFFLLAEYAGMVVMALLFTVLFLGGWRGPWGDIGWVGALWTLLKATVVGAVILWFRVAWPRVREDQLQSFAWLVLLPIALVQLAVTAVVVVAIS
ncbi:MAG: NADH-quinone oxidoreductase subunit NuoH [Ornithinimicrobium sp.]|uniref:NADH-quinone oxidoreductase subunit NuoH n=1 Tax=Ornithinimicrobium sp. TaxID=1977084 RepID=UPI0026E10B23|nr:NADH-quinone oxidoreductase subunit NuoH [Ornithinimicrobium sp.]MDO5741155.1 NADH-quinone oxidoreductase subunit NuoH [Ornithinimicrobium sp.]